MSAELQLSFACYIAQAPQLILVMKAIQKPLQKDNSLTILICKILFVIYERLLLSILAITSQFGYPRKLESHNLKAKEILNELKAQFDIVLMGEYLDQSLLVMKKALNWSMNDLVYINHVDKNVNYDYGDIAPQIQVCIQIKQLNICVIQFQLQYLPTYVQELAALERFVYLLLSFSIVKFIHHPKRWIRPGCMVGDTRRETFKCSVCTM